MIKTILYVAPSTHYFKKVCTLIKKYIGPKKSLIYVSTNKPVNNLKNLFKEEGIKTKEIFFIDCISKSIGNIANEESKNVLFLNSPHDLTGLSLAINQAVKFLPDEKVVFIDSLSSLLIYNHEDIIGRFSNFIINRMRLNNTGLVLIVLDSDVDSKIIKRIESFVDEVIKNGN